MSDQLPRYSMVIEWSNEDSAYIVSFPEWEMAGHLAHVDGETYVEAARKGQEMLDFLTWSTREDVEPLPIPRHFDFDGHHVSSTSNDLTDRAD